MGGEKFMEKEERFPIVVVMITYIIILMMYLYTYSQKSYVFWAFFVIERLMNMHYEDYIEKSLLIMVDENLKWPMLLLTLLFLVLSLGIFLYTPFKYPKLFGILVLGEIIDAAVKVIKYKLFGKDGED